MRGVVLVPVLGVLTVAAVAGCGGGRSGSASRPVGPAKCRLVAPADRPPRWVCERRPCQPVAAGGTSWRICALAAGLRDSDAEAINDRGGIVGYIDGPGKVHGPAFWQQAQIAVLSQGGVANAINDRFQVVGSNYDGTGFAEQSAFLWQPGKVMLLEFGTVNEATDINDLGQVVGTDDSSEVYWANPRAFLWQKGTRTDLDSLGGNGSYAYAINDLGQVVGKSKTAAGQWHASLWKNGTVRDLRTLGGTKSEATAINNRGQIVGSSTTARGHWHAVLWENGTMRDLGTLGAYQSHATGINERGQVVGYATTRANGGQTVTHAFIYQDGRMRDLHTLPDDLSSQAVAINNHSQIVGWSADKIGLQHAVLWTLKTVG